MYVALFVSFIAVLFALSSRYQKSDNGLKFSFLIIFLFLALRFDFGNDYRPYLLMFNDISGDKTFSPSLYRIEIGWYTLNYAFRTIGFFAMTILLAAFSCTIVYRFIKKYVSKQYYWIAVFVYVFHPSQMLILSSAMRQAVAVSLFIVSIDFLIQRSYIKYIIIIFISTLFHESAYILFGVILLPLIHWKISVTKIALIFSLFVMSLFFAQNVYNYIDVFTENYFNNYIFYVEDSNTKYDFNLGLGFVLNMLIYLIIFYFIRGDKNFTYNIFYKLSVLSFLLIPFGLAVQLTSRLNFYFIPSLMIVLPIAISRIKNPFRSVLIVVVVLFYLYNINVFFTSDVYKLAFGTYKTIFSSQVWQ